MRYIICLPLLVFMLSACNSPSSAPPAPVIRQEYPSSDHPFVYDVGRAGYLICGGADGKQEIPLKLPSDYSAVKFNFKAGLLLVLCAKDNNLFKRSAYIYDANAKCLAFSVLERQPVYGENKYRLWLADRPEALIFLAEGFRQESSPAFKGKDPETYYLGVGQKATRLKIARLLDACFDPEEGHCILLRNGAGRLELRYYLADKQVWTQEVKMPGNSGVPKLSATAKPGIVAILRYDGESTYYTRRGLILKDGDSVDPRAR